MTDPREVLEKLVPIVEKAVAKGPCCPKCETPLRVSLMIPKEQRFIFAISHDNEFIAAETIGGTVTAMRKLMRGIAKQQGVNLDVFISNLSMTAGRVEIEFFMTHAPK